MKKLLILILAMLMTLSVFLVSGCGETPDEGNVSNSVTSSSIEETSSSTRPSRNFGSRPDNSTQNGNNNGISVIDPTNSDGPTQTPSTSVSDIIVSGETLIIPETPVGNASDNAAMIILTINFIESVSPTNFREKLDMIVSCEEEYNKLTPSEKAEVVNYGHLVAAREKYNEFDRKVVVIEWETLMQTTIPAAENIKNADVENVYRAKDIYDNAMYKSDLQTLTEFATYEAKLNNCLTRIKNSTKEQAFIAQDLNGNGIIETAVLHEGKTRDETKGEKKRTAAPTFFNFGTFEVHGSAGNNNTVYSDLQNTNKTIWQYADVQTLTFTADAPGTVEFYPRKDQDRSYTVTQNGEVIATFNSKTSPVTFKVNSGLVTIAVDGSSDGGCIAIKFSYPNLG